jgi:hypothetical protein
MTSIRIPTPSNSTHSSASGVGQTAGGAASRVSGLFFSLFRGLLGIAQAGARADGHIHGEQLRAPIKNSQPVLGQGHKCSFADPMLHQCHAQGNAVCRHKPKGVGGRQPNQLMLVVDNTATLDCPEWPQCGCPGGTTRPECPAVSERRHV